MRIFIFKIGDASSGLRPLRAILPAASCPRPQSLPPLARHPGVRDDKLRRTLFPAAIEEGNRRNGFSSGALSRRLSTWKVAQLRVLPGLVPATYVFLAASKLGASAHIGLFTARLRGLRPGA